MDSSSEAHKAGIAGRFSKLESRSPSHELPEYTVKGGNHQKQTAQVPKEQTTSLDETMKQNNYKHMDGSNTNHQDPITSRAGAETSFISTAMPEPEVVISAAERDGEQVSLRSHVLSMWYLLVVIITPIIFLPIIMVDQEYQREARCGYVIAVMAVYWTTEALPIAVTSLLPVVLLPALGVLSARDTSSAYFNDTSMLFVGGLLVAIAIEVWNLHKRIALLVLRVVGSEPKCLLLGITLVTWFLSMWISNTATTAMMMTIVQALLNQFETIKKTSKTDRSGGMTRDKVVSYGTLEGGQHPSDDCSSPRTSKVTETDQSDGDFTRLRKALSITVAYAANIGGIGALTGTGPNLVFFSSAQELFESVGLESPINFATWLIYGLPLSLLIVLIMYLWMNVIFLRCRGGCRCCCCKPDNYHEQLAKVNNIMDEEYRKLGPISYAEGTVLVSFLLLIVMWISRDVGGAGGWADWFPAGFVRDSTPSLLMGILMFVLPATFPCSVLIKPRSTAGYNVVKPLLQWKDVHEKMPWSLFLLLGGGYALAKAATDSGLSEWLGDQLLVFRDLDPWAILLIICYVVTFATEVTSNTAMATLMMPILSQMAISLQLNPLFLMFPAAITTSFAFMLPVATPPNAIVFSHGHVRVIDMILSGFVLNALSVPVLLLATATWGNAYFKFDQTFPEFLPNTTTITPVSQ